MNDMSNMNVQQRVLDLQSVFSGTHAYRQLEIRFRSLLDHRRAQIDAGVVTEARAIALIGASGSGKTTAAKRLISSQPDLIFEDNVANTAGQCEIVSVTVPTPATLKFVGQTTLEALGFPLKRDKPAQIIWGMVKDHLQERRTLFLHFDEAQDLALHQSPREFKLVVNTLKSLLQHRSWPVGHILSGTEELKSILNHDHQLARRVYPVEFPRLHPAGDSERVTRLLVKYGHRASLTLSEEVLKPELAVRLIHAADREFGLLIEMTISALEEVMVAGHSEVSIHHFVAMFRKRAGCIDGLNPFLVNDFERINTRNLLDGDEPA